MMETEMFSVNDDEQQPLDLSMKKNRADESPAATVVKRVKPQEPERDAKRAKKSMKKSPSSEDLLQAAFRSTVVVRSPASTTSIRTASAVTASSTPRQQINGDRVTAAADSPAEADQRRSMVCGSPMPPSPPSLVSEFLVPRKGMPTPQPPDHVADGPGSAFAAYYPTVYAEYDPFFLGTKRAAFSSSSFPPCPPLPPIDHFRVPPRDHFQHLRQQQQQTLREQVHAINLLEQLQHQHQQQQQQQQQQSAYGNPHHLYHHHHHRLQTYDLNAMMMAQQMNNDPSLFVSAAESPSSPPPPPPPSSSLSNESNPLFPYGTAYDCLPKSTYAFGYPYSSGIFDTDIGSDGIGDGGGGGSVSGYSGGRSDCLSPEPTTAADFHRHMHYSRSLHQQHHDSFLHRHVMQKMRSSAMGGVPDPNAVDPDEIAAIYRQSDFVSFRQRYMDSLGPPRNFEKMRRSTPNKNLGGGGGCGIGIGQQYDHTYVVKRQKNNEAAKKSRDAKRQKYIENQISVMYLTKKVSEMKEIKRRLLLAM